MQRFQTIYASQETGRWGVFDNQTNLGITGIIFQQDVAASTWVFTHNQNASPFLLQFYMNNNDGTQTRFEPSDITFSNNVITVTVGASLIGTILVIFAQATGA